MNVSNGSTKNTISVVEPTIPNQRVNDLAEKPFDPGEWLSEECKVQGINSVKLTTVFERRKEFVDICDIVKEELESIFKGSLVSDKEKEEWVLRQHDAIVGDEQAVAYFINKIQEVLKKKNITSSDYPDFYDSLGEAIFHEVWGKSILAKWENRFVDSEAAVIRGTELWIDIDGTFIRQDETFENYQHVEKIIEAFKMRDSNAVLNHQNPELETEKEDGSRITMIIQPRAKETYIIFRRFIVNNFTLDEQAERNTIPKEDIPIYRSIAKVMANMIIAGRVRSAKSTFMKTLIGERESNYVVACIEKHFELALTKHYPERLIYEFQATEGELHQVIPRVLRMEHDYLVIGEIRSKEMEAAMIACERGERGMLSTYHLTDVEEIVPQLTRHLLDEFPNRTPQLEMERVARNIDLVITMGTDRDRKTKRVTGVTEVVWDPHKREYSTNRLIYYRQRDNQYYYSSKISARLLELFKDENEEASHQLIRLLEEREKVNSIESLREEGVPV